MINQYENGLKIKELLCFIKENVNIDDDSEVWIMTNKTLSSPCFEISTLNKSDIVLSVKEHAL